MSGKAMKPVSVDVITYAPTVFYHCQHCEVAFTEIGLGERIRRAEATGALPEDLSRDYQAVSDWVHALLERHAGRVRIRVLDVASIPGVLASIRHRVRRYPAVIVDGRDRLTGTDFTALDPIIDRRVAAALAAPTADAERRPTGTRS